MDASGSKLWQIARLPPLPSLQQIPWVQWEPQKYMDDRAKQAKNMISEHFQDCEDWCIMEMLEIHSQDLEHHLLGVRESIDANNMSLQVAHLFRCRVTLCFVPECSVVTPEPTETNRTYGGVSQGAGRL